MNKITTVGSGMSKGGNRS